MPNPHQLATLRLADASHSWRILITVAQAIEDSQQPMLTKTVAAFCLAAQMGAFSTSDTPAPVGASVRDMHFNDNCAEFEVDLDGIDQRSTQVLRQMLCGLRTADINVIAITIAGPGLALQQGPVSSSIAQFEANEESIYPRLIAGVPLRGDDTAGFSIGARLRRCEVTIDDRVTTSHVEALREITYAWFSLLECGGYALPVEMPWVVNNVGGAINPFDVNSLELTVYKFESSEQAWLSLANMIHLAGPSRGLRAVEVRVDD